MADECLVCQEVKGEVGLPGGVLWEDSLAEALRAEGAERVHVAVIGLGVDHFHQHLFPRYPGVPEGTSWMAVDELPDAPHGDAREIAGFAARLRSHL